MYGRIVWIIFTERYASLILLREVRRAANDPDRNLFFKLASIIIIVLVLPNDRVSRTLLVFLHSH
jgi:hypothetical protein